MLNSERRQQAEDIQLERVARGVSDLALCQVEADATQRELALKVSECERLLRLYQEQLVALGRYVGVELRAHPEVNHWKEAVPMPSNKP